MFLSDFQKRLNNLMYLSGRTKDQKFSFSNWLLNSQLQGVDVGSSRALEDNKDFELSIFFLNSEIDVVFLRNCLVDTMIKQIPGKDKLQMFD